MKNTQRHLIGQGQTIAAKMEEEIPVPEQLTPDQQMVYKRLWRASNMKNSGFQTAAIEVLATNPDLAEKYLSRHRDQTVEQIAALLSDTGPLLDMPTETVQAVLSLDSARIAPIVKIAHLLQSVGIQLATHEVKTAVDLAKVMNIMEAEEAVVGEQEFQGDYASPQQPGPAFDTYDEMKDGDNGPPGQIRARRARDRLASTGK